MRQPMHNVNFKNYTGSIAKPAMLNSLCNFGVIYTTGYFCNSNHIYTELSLDDKTLLSKM